MLTISGLRCLVQHTYGMIGATHRRFAEEGRSMPNQPRTPTHSVRVPQELWDEAKAHAQADSEDLTKVINRMLTGYVSRKRRAVDPVTGEPKRTRRAGRVSS